MSSLILYLLLALFPVCILCCPEDPVPPCTCTLIGFHSSIINCKNAENEVQLAKSLMSMRNTTVPIKIVQIFYTNINFLPSNVFKGLRIPTLQMAESSMVALSDSGTAFVGLEDSLETFKLQECILFSGWSWSHLRNLKVLTELHTMHAGLSSIDEDVKNIAHLNITNLFFTKDSISYIHDTAFATFQNLETLSLKMNDIKTMKRSMFPDPALHLRQIILSYNELESIPNDLFADMPNLVVISLSNNNILTLNEAAFKPIWHQLVKIDLYDNPLRCDCRMKWLLKVTFPKNTWVKCRDPQKLKGKNIKNLTEKDIWC